MDPYRSPNNSTYRPPITNYGSPSSTNIYRTYTPRGATSHQSIQFPKSPNSNTNANTAKPSFLSSKSSSSKNVLSTPSKGNLRNEIRGHLQTLKNMKTDLQRESSLMKGTVTGMVELTKKDIKEQIMYYFTKIQFELNRRETSSDFQLKQVSSEKEELNHQKELLKDDIRILKKQNEELKRQVEKQKTDMVCARIEFNQDKQKHEELWDKMLKNMSAEKNKMLTKLNEDLSKKDLEFKTQIQKLRIENEQLKTRVIGSTQPSMSSPSSKREHTSPTARRLEFDLYSEKASERSGSQEKKKKAGLPQIYVPDDDDDALSQPRSVQSNKADYGSSTRSNISSIYSPTSKFYNQSLANQLEDLQSQKSTSLASETVREAEIEKLKNQVMNLIELKNKHEDIIENLTKEKAIYQEKFIELEKRVQAVAANKQSPTKAEKDLQEKLEKLEKENGDLEQQAKSAQNSYESSIKNLESTIDEIKKERDEALKRFDIYEEERSRQHKEDIDELNSVIQKLEKQQFEHSANFDIIKEKDTEIAHLREHLNKKDKQLSELETDTNKKINKLHDKERELTTENISLKQTQKDLDAKIENLVSRHQKEIDDSKKKLKELEDSSEQQLSDLQTQVTNLSSESKKQKEAHELEMKGLDEQIKKLEAEKAILEKDKGSEIAQIAIEKEDQITQLHNKLNELTLRLKQEQTQNTQISTERDSLKTRMNELYDEIKSLQTENKKLMEDIFKLEDKKFENEKQEVQAELKKKDGVILELTQMKDQLQDDIKNLKTDVEKAATASQDLQRDNENHLSRIQILETCLEDKDVKIREIKNLHEIEREQLLMQMQKLHLEIDYLNGRVKEFQGIQDNQVQLDTQIKKNDELEQNIKKLNIDLNLAQDAQQELNTLKANMAELINQYDLTRSQDFSTQLHAIGAALNDFLTLQAQQQMASTNSGSPSKDGKSMDQKERETLQKEIKDLKYTLGQRNTEVDRLEKDIKRIMSAGGGKNPSKAHKELELLKGRLSEMEEHYKYQLQQRDDNINYLRAHTQALSADCQMMKEFIIHYHGESVFEEEVTPRNRSRGGTTTNADSKSSQLQEFPPAQQQQQQTQVQQPNIPQQQEFPQPETSSKPEEDVENAGQQAKKSKNKKKNKKKKTQVQHEEYDEGQDYGEGDDGTGVERGGKKRNTRGMRALKNEMVVYAPKKSLQEEEEQQQPQEEGETQQIQEIQTSKAPTQEEKKTMREKPPRIENLGSGTQFVITPRGGDDTPSHQASTPRSSTSENKRNKGNKETEQKVKALEGMLKQLTDKYFDEIKEVKDEMNNRMKQQNKQFASKEAEYEDKLRAIEEDRQALLKKIDDMEWDRAYQAQKDGQSLDRLGSMEVSTPKNADASAENKQSGAPKKPRKKKNKKGTVKENNNMEKQDSEGEDN